MPALQLSEAAFGLYLRKPIQKFQLDLSRASVIEVLDEYQRLRQKRNRDYSISSLIYNINIINEHYDIELMPLQVTDDFYLQFAMHLLQRDVKPSTIKTYFGQLRAALTWATLHNCAVAPTYKTYDIDNYATTKVALTTDEISHIYHYDISSIKCRPQHRRTLEKVRDMFVLSCNLGQRYSDMCRIEPSNFKDGKFRCVQQKTGNKAVVDLATMTIDYRATMHILEKYNYTSPFPHTINPYNEYLHELLQCIGEEFNDTIISENKVCGKIVKVEQPKWKVVASHCARRTFATYHVKRDIQEAKIRRCTGHADSRSFAQYIIFDDED